MLGTGYAMLAEDVQSGRPRWAYLGDRSKGEVDYPLTVR